MSCIPTYDGILISHPFINKEILEDFVLRFNSAFDEYTHYNFKIKPMELENNSIIEEEFFNKNLILVKNLPDVHKSVFEKIGQENNCPFALTYEQIEIIDSEIKKLCAIREESKRGPSNLNYRYFENQLYSDSSK